MIGFWAVQRVLVQVSEGGQRNYLNQRKEVAMREPILLGEIMKKYLLESNDDFAVAFRKLSREHHSDFLNEMGKDKSENDNK